MALVNIALMDNVLNILKKVQNLHLFAGLGWKQDRRTMLTNINIFICATSCISTVVIKANSVTANSVTNECAKHFESIPRSLTVKSYHDTADRGVALYDSTCQWPALSEW
jgi:hypothetical protein